MSNYDHKATLSEQDKGPFTQHKEHLEAIARRKREPATPLSGVADALLQAEDRRIDHAHIDKAVKRARPPITDDLWRKRVDADLGMLEDEIAEIRKKSRMTTLDLKHAFSLISPLQNELRNLRESAAERQDIDGMLSIRKDMGELMDLTDARLRTLENWMDDITVQSALLKDTKPRSWDEVTTASDLQKDATNAYDKGYKAGYEICRTKAFSALKALHRHLMGTDEGATVYKFLSDFMPPTEENES
jgi:hypothetical protein